MPKHLLLTLPALLGLLLASAAPAAAASTKTCASFASQAAAQAAYRADPVGLASLDRDRDGIACEDNPAPYDEAPVRLTTAISPSPSAVVSSPAPSVLPKAPRTGDGSGQPGDLVGLVSDFLLLGALAAGLLVCGRLLRGGVAGPKD